jgi:hypothetical protein
MTLDEIMAGIEAAENGDVRRERGRASERDREREREREERREKR